LLLKRENLSTQQETAIAELVARERASLWAKPGTGKTVVAATALEEMFGAPTLIVATRRICELVWAQEFARWEHLAHLKTALLTGKHGPAKRLKHLASDADYFLINYELLPWLADELQGQPWPFGSVVFDEVSKLKWPGTRRFKKIRKPVLDIPIRFGLTGTPRGNSVMGLWGQTYVTCATHDHTPLAPTMARFKTRWFWPVDKERRIWRIWKALSGTEEELRKRAAPYAYAMPRSTAAKEARVIPVPVPMAAKTRKLYNKLEVDLEVEIDGEMITAVEPGVMRGKLLQICSGAIYTAQGDEEYAILGTDKLDALDEIIEEMQGAPLLVFYRFRHELYRIRERHKDIKTIDDADDWIANGGVLVANPQAVAHGLNLHVGGCSTSVWYTLPDSQELWEQGNRRLARTGQTEEVRALVLATANTIEERVAASLAQHGKLQDELIDAAVT